jgi:anti-anti-sigma regulatory factor
MLTVEVSRSPTGTILHCLGRIVAGQEAEKLESVAFAQNGRQLLLDLSGTEAIDARGLGALNAIRQWAIDKGIDFAILNPSCPVRYLMALVKLDVNIAVLEDARAVAC